MLWTFLTAEFKSNKNPTNSIPYEDGIGWYFFAHIGKKLVLTFGSNRGRRVGVGQLRIRGMIIPKIKKLTNDNHQQINEFSGTTFMET